jgi:hypothetical protein
MRLDNRYCWIVHFRRDLIVRVRLYLDAILVARLFDKRSADDGRLNQFFRKIQRPGISRRSVNGDEPPGGPPCCTIPFLNRNSAS